MNIEIEQRIKTTTDLGQMIRAYRKEQDLTLERLAGLSNLSMRFLSELERGKETAEIGKALLALNRLGLEVIIKPRGEYKTLLDEVKEARARYGKE